MYHSLERFGKFKTFDDITLQHINQFDLFIREEETFTTKPANHPKRFSHSQLP